MLYSVLCLSGKFSLDELKKFRQWGSPTPGHPRSTSTGVSKIPQVLLVRDMPMQLVQPSQHVSCRHVSAKGWIIPSTAFISDGGCRRRSLKVGRIAGHLGLSNLIMFYDSNNIQLSTTTDAVTSEDVAAKYRAWNWRVISIDGNNVDEIRKALTEAKLRKKNRR